MGEKIRDIGELEVKGMIFKVEINEPIDKINGGLVHIQNSSFRMELSQRDFYEMAAAIMLAKKQLMRIKRMDED